MWSKMLYRAIEQFHNLIRGQLFNYTLFCSGDGLEHMASAQQIFDFSG